MKDLNMLVWLTQLGLSVAAPLAGFVLLAVWLQKQFQWGAWVIIAGVALGAISAVSGLRITLKAMERMAKGKPEDKPSVGFNDHD